MLYVSALVRELTVIAKHHGVTRMMVIDHGTDGPGTAYSHGFHDFE